MVSKLDDRGLVEYEPYRGVALTDWGDAFATEAGWRFCVVSTFFRSVLDTTVEDRTAFDIGFVLPRDGVFRLHDLVGSACLGRCPASGDDRRRCVT
jgi:Mn-dependent DtxR family transcriptional regulator